MKSKNIEGLLPFLESEDLRDLAYDVLNGKIDIRLEILLPFMDEEDVDKILNETNDHPEWLQHFNVTAILPFASEEALDNLLTKNSKALLANESLKLSALLPFLSGETIDKLFMEQVADGKIDADIVPFVSDECLHKLVLEYVENPNLKLNISAIYPYLDNDDVSLLFKAYIKRDDEEDESEDEEDDETEVDVEDDEDCDISTIVISNGGRTVTVNDKAATAEEAMEILHKMKQLTHTRNIFHKHDGDKN